MKAMTLWTSLLMIGMLMQPIVAERTTVVFNNDWLFAKGSPDGAQDAACDDSQWQKVRLPHDWAISGPFDPNGNPNTGKLPWQGKGWYRKHFDVKAEDTGKCVYFLFDGVMAMPTVYINGRKAGGWDYGYNSFWIDATPYIAFGKKNVIAVAVDTTRHGSRWYPGAGIYRKVQMITTDALHVAPWGTCIRTPEVSDQAAVIQIQTLIENAAGTDQTLSLETRILDPSGTSVASLKTENATLSGPQQEFTQTIRLANPQRWDIDTPRLYTAQTTLYRHGTVCDTYTTSFGIRTFRFDADKGFFLNDRPLKIKGVNLHHDHGALGAVFLPRAMERQLEIMKDMGCNAIRTSHNMPAPELLDLCDRMGFVVFDESFDKWSNTADFHRGMDLAEFGERQIKNFVLRDRNHPSVVLWSAGNEMSDIETNKAPQAREKLEMMVGFFRKYDPTRPVTIACHIASGGLLDQKLYDVLDVQSWNYGRKYVKAHQVAPHQPTLCSESASALSTRGHYELPHPAQKDLFSQSGQVSSYDHHAATWADIPDIDFKGIEEYPFVCGEFVWTGFDYLGEPTPYQEDKINGQPLQCTTARSSYFGIVDLAGLPKDRYYLYRSHWAPDKTTIHILPHWNWDGWEGKIVPVYVYTNGDSAELFLNGKSLGLKTKQPDSDNAMDRYRLRWEEVVYEPGELKAVAYKDDKKIGEAVMKTAGQPAQIRLTADRREISASGDDLCYVTVELTDAQGTLCPKADNLIRFNVEGPAVIAGVDNGNPQSLEPFQADFRRLFYGKAVLILRSVQDQAGTITVTAHSEGIQSGTIQVHSRSIAR